MQYYRVCFMKDQRTVCFDEFPAEDDISAIREAQRHVATGSAELRCGDRRVTEIRAAEARQPLTIGLFG